MPSCLSWTTAEYGTERHASRDLFMRIYLTVGGAAGLLAPIVSVPFIGSVFRMVGLLPSRSGVAVRCQEEGRETAGPVRLGENWLGLEKESARAENQVRIVAHLKTAAPWLGVVLGRRGTRMGRRKQAREQERWARAAELVLDREFEELLPRPGQEEQRQLEQTLLQQGCRDILVVWRRHGRK